MKLLPTVRLSDVTGLPWARQPTEQPPIERIIIMPNAVDLTTNPLFDRIKPQPDDQRKYFILIGYVAGTTKEIVTVYEDLDLSTYLEIPEPAIIWAEKAIPGQVSSPTKLVIEANAKVNRVTTAARKVEAGFLSGLIAS